MRCFIIGLAVFMMAGCDANPRRTDIPRTNWSRERLDAASSDRAFEAARYALRQWFTIDQASASDGLLTTFPVEFEERGGTGRIRDAAVSYRNRVRHRATVRVMGAEPDVSVECVVIRERLDTADHRVFAMNRQFDDVNNQTPISGEGATSPSQNEVWTEIGRDRKLERDILNVVRERLSGGPAAAPAPAPPPAASPNEPHDLAAD